MPPGETERAAYLVWARKVRGLVSLDGSLTSIRYSASIASRYT